jgi:hypothetical protein
VRIQSRGNRINKARATATITSPEAMEAVL